MERRCGSDLTLFALRRQTVAASWSRAVVAALVEQRAPVSGAQGPARRRVDGRAHRMQTCRPFASFALGCECLSSPPASRCPKSTAGLCC